MGTDADGHPFDEPWGCTSVVRVLMYRLSNSRTDIQFIGHQCASFTHNPRKSPKESLKRICRYLVGTQGQVLTFDPNSDMNMDCYVDAYFAGLWRHEDDKYPVYVKSRMGYVVTIGECPLH